MTFVQPLAEQIEYDRVRVEFSAPFQQAGLRVGAIDAIARDSSSPDDLRRRLVAQLQRVLPKSEPMSVRAELPRAAPADMIRETEQKVRAAIERQAHASPTLIPVVSKDRSGREETTFFGSKKSWMRQFEAPTMLMGRLGAVVY
jgi:hypothetical protein